MNDQKDFVIQNDNTNSAVTRDKEDQQNRPQYITEQMFENLELNSVSVASKSQWQAILDGIKSEENETLRLQCLMELCNHLVVLTEEHLNGFKVDQFIPPLVSILQSSDDPNLMLFVCRAFSHLLEALPTSVGYLIRNGAIPALCEKLLSIEYIDLAEQVINALLKISEIQNGAITILKSGGIMALLTYLDFFSIDIQYKAITTVTNILSIIPMDCLDIIRDSIQLFNQLLDHQDLKILKNACISIFKIIKSLSQSKKDLNRIRDLGVVSKLVNLLSIYSKNIEQEEAVITDYVMRAITLMVSKDGTLVNLFFENNLPLIICQLIENEKKRNVRQKVRNVQSLYHIISMIDVMLPDTDTDQMIQIPRHFYHEKIDEDENKIKIEEYKNNPEYMKAMLHHLLHNLVDLYGVRTSVSLNQKCLSSIYKMIIGSSQDILHDELKDLSFSNFIVRLLGSKDHYPVMVALNLGEDLMEKLPDIFIIYFVREGVINEINQLIETNKINDESNEIDEDETGPEREDMKRKRLIFQKASEFKSKYFQEEEKTQTEELRMFHNIAVAIKEMNKSDCDMETMEKMLRQLSASLNQGISTYELIQSGLIGSLLEFLAFDDDSLCNYEQQQIRASHAQLFQKVFLSDEGYTSLITLLNECQHGLEKLDDFEADTISSHDNPIGCLKYLTRRFTFKFIPHQDETLMKDEIQVYAEPLASIEDVKSYLKNKLIQKRRLADINHIKEFQMEEEPNHDEIDEEEEEFMEEESDEDEQEGYDYLEEEEDEEIREEDEEEEDDEEEDDEEYINEEYDDEENVVDLSEIEQFKNKESMNKEEKKLINPFEYPSDMDNTFNQNIKLFFKGVEIDDASNVFKSVYMMNKQNEKRISGEYRSFHRFWAHKYEIEYLHVKDEQSNSKFENKSKESLMDINHFFANSIDEVVEELKDLPNRSTLCSLLYLIKLIYTICVYTQPYSLPSFTNDQLTTKVIRITQDPLLLCTGVIPNWINELMNHHQHLFTLDVRTHYFRSTSFGISRTFLSLKERLEDFMKFRLGRVYRQKVRIHRDKILESAFVIFKKISTSSSILEIEYFDEVATGLGPTLEFFTLLSNEFQRRDLKLWVDQSSQESEEKSLVFHPAGLFPIPTNQSEFEGHDNLKRLLFYNFGCFIAKSIVDQRLIDVHLSNALVRFLFGETLTIQSLKEVFPEICQVIEDLNELVIKRNQINCNPVLTNEEKEIQKKMLTYKNARIEDLSLYFVLPGYDIVLVENGEDLLVAIDNLDVYVNRMIHVLAKECIEIQMNAIKDGFNSIFNSKHLRVFNPSEIDTLIFGSSEKDQEWDRGTILENTICDHGYTSSSKAIKFIIEIMSEFSIEERRRFLRFITGSPRLPPGGFKGLNPKLTFVRKEAEPPSKSDDYLPSVNTCFLYLKLPDYSTKEIMRQNLMKAIEHGQSGFALS